MLPVRQASVLPAASFRFYLTVDTLAVRLTIPLIGLVGNFHPKETRHAGHTNRKALINQANQSFNPLGKIKII